MNKETADKVPELPRERRLAQILSKKTMSRYSVIKALPSLHSYYFSRFCGTVCDCLVSIEALLRFDR